MLSEHNILLYSYFSNSQQLAVYNYKKCRINNVLGETRSRTGRFWVLCLHVKGVSLNTEPSRIS